MGKVAGAELPPFARRFFDGTTGLSTIGRGDIGGKASGLRLINDRILPALDATMTQEFSVRVPIMTVLTTEVFDAFLEENNLTAAAVAGLSDDRIAHRVQHAELPPQFAGDLYALAASATQPLAIRSSSLLEDALDHPLAGVYATKMIPNNEHDVEARFRRLVQAVKYVWASTFFADATAYLRALGKSTGDEKMAVIVQEIVGSRTGDRFYPTLSGVARSFNCYPSGSAQPQDGVVNLALGLGKTIVGGGLSWSYSPVAPLAPPPFNDLSDLLKNTQTRFWAVNMGPLPMPDPIRETEFLCHCSLRDAERDGALGLLVSTYDAGSDRLYSGLGSRGPRVLTFAPILGSSRIPFNEVVRHVLAVSEVVLGDAVELEIAVELDRRSGVPGTFGLVQLRPMRLATGSVEVTPEQMMGSGVLLASEKVLGNGSCDDVEDVVYVKPEAFDPAATPQMALELERVNCALTDANRPYLLIGFGRWGTSDPWRGIPVTWGQICGARAIVEATLPDMQPDLSQGSHFFHNLLGLQVLYLSLEHHGVSQIDWDWLGKQPALTETRYIRHVRVTTPLLIRVDGGNRRGVIRHHG